MTTAIAVLSWDSVRYSRPVLGQPLRCLSDFQMDLSLFHAGVTDAVGPLENVNSSGSPDMCLMEIVPRSLSGGVALVLLCYLLLGVAGNLLTVAALVRCPRVRNVTAAFIVRCVTAAFIVRCVTAAFIVRCVTAAFIVRCVTAAFIVRCVTAAFIVRCVTAAFIVRCVTAAFIVSLCITDLLLCVLVLPWEVSRFLFRRWLWGDGLLCTLVPLLRYWNVAASLLSIAMITVNRYIMIAQPAAYSSIYKPVWVGLMIVFCWVFPMLMLLPTLLSSWGRFGLDSWLSTCTILATSDEHPKQALFGLGFCVPALVIVVSYSLIFRTVKKSERRMLNHRRPSNIQNAQNDKEYRRRRNEWRVTQMVLTIFLAFVVTYLPITLVKTFDTDTSFPILHVLGYVLIYMSCCINPVIYVIMNKQYRQAYKTVLLCRRPRIQSFSIHSSGERKSAVTYNPSLDKLDIDEDAAEQTITAALWEAESSLKINDGSVAGVFKQISDT
ncbi:G protein-coupled receptor rhodopsin-like [Trinorchestia longiramus]|nr:G protein-coupled receptor rhodopsin-like [Trinorchestia longiramus]